MKQQYPQINRIYAHYKGGTYEVLHLAKNTTDDTIMVIYQSREFGSHYARPLSEWWDVVIDEYEEGSPYNQRFYVL